VAWVYAGTIATEVIHHHANWYRPSVHLVVVAVGGGLLAITTLQSVSLNAEMPLPDPAARDRIDPIVNGRESFDQLSWVGFAGSGETSPTLPLRLAVSLALALSACASSADSNGVGLIERMAVHTVGLGLATSSDRVPSKRVLSGSDGLEMRRVHTGGVPAQVVQMEACGDWTSMSLEVNAVCILHRAPNTHASVPVHGHALPDPAARFSFDYVVNGRESFGSLVMPIDIADRFTLDVSMSLGSLLGKRRRQPTATVAIALVDLAIGITAHRTPLGAEEPHFNPRPMGSV
jgi:hypothetical protein